MKKLIGSLALAAATMSSFGQGTVAFYNLSTTYYTKTNSALLGSGLSGTVGNTANVANGFYYALLIKPYSAANTADPLAGGWNVGAVATNYLTGGIRGAGGSSGAPVTGWPGPTGATYDTGTLMNYMIVGWSSTLGLDWATVKNEYSSGTWNALGFFGFSAIANGYSGGGPNSLPAPNVFGTGVNAGGLTSGLTLYAVPVPEPATFALAGLGAAALMVFRRRK